MFIRPTVIRIYLRVGRSRSWERISDDAIKLIIIQIRNYSAFF